MKRLTRADFIKVFPGKSFVSKTTIEPREVQIQLGTLRPNELLSQWDWPAFYISPKGKRLIAVFIPEGEILWNLRDEFRLNLEQKELVEVWRRWIDDRGVMISRYNPDGRYAEFKYHLGVIRRWESKIEENPDVSHNYLKNLLIQRIEKVRAEFPEYL